MDPGEHQSNRNGRGMRDDLNGIRRNTEIVRFQKRRPEACGRPVFQSAGYIHDRNIEFEACDALRGFDGTGE